MSTERDTSSQPLRIHEQTDRDRPVVLHPEDDDLFVRTGQQVIQACHLDISIEVWLDEFRSMLNEVAQWCNEHQNGVRACYAAPRGGSIGLYFVPQSESFDFDLADLLAPLNRDLVKKYNVGMIEIHQIPQHELDRFIPPNTKRVVFPHEPGAHQAVET